MLTDFFTLNPSPDLRTITQPSDFVQLFHNSVHVKDIVFKPDRLEVSHLGRRRTLFTEKTFENISFKDTAIIGITFNKCKFIDCLFIGTRFEDCEFHGCSYSGCNPHKIEFKDTYIDPKPFERMLDRRKRANIGVYFFQQLHKNSVEMEQRQFSRTAEFNFHKWERYILDYKHRKGTIGHSQYYWAWLQNYLFHIFAGYGLKFHFFAIWSAIIIAISFSVNYYLWGHLCVVGQNQLEEERTVITVMYYTGTAMGRFGDLAPISDLGRGLFLVETFLGLIIVALFLTWLGKRVWK